MSKRKPNPLKPKKISNYQRGPLWDWTQGVTQSSIESFLACREQFSLNYIEGWTSRAFSTPLEFGTVFHSMLEIEGTDSPENIARSVTAKYFTARKKTLKGSADELHFCLANAQTIFPLYVKYYAEDNAKLNWLQREQVFKFKHTFDYPQDRAGTVNSREDIWLNGKRDGDYRNSTGKLGLFETKTKSTLDDIAIQDGLRADLQTMLYLLSEYVSYGEMPEEILYNCVRRPQLRIKAKESLDQYCLRLKEDILDRPDWYFRRYEVTVLPGDLEVFVKTTLDPVLRALKQWWDSISDDPLDRWQSPYHYRDLTKLTNRYGKVPLYNLMILGRTAEYYQRSSLFPELEESLELTGA